MSFLPLGAKQFAILPIGIPERIVFRNEEEKTSVMTPCFTPRKLNKKEIYITMVLFFCVHVKFFSTLHISTFFVKSQGMTLSEKTWKEVYG